MTGTTILAALFGAALALIGVFAAALADRIRNLRVTKTAAAPRAVTVVEADIVPLPVKKPKQEVGATVANDAIAALVAAGYKKATASEAVWSCGATERETVERWTAAALRRCAKGGVS